MREPFCLRGLALPFIRRHNWTSWAVTRRAGTRPCSASFAEAIARNVAMFCKKRTGPSLCGNAALKMPLLVTVTWQAFRS